MANPEVVDEAGPLWRLMEDFFDSWPVRPVWVLLAGVVVLAIVVLVNALANRKKS